MGAGDNEDEARLSRALATVVGALPYLRAHVGPLLDVARPADEVADGRWVYCDELLADGAWLARTISATGRRLGAPSGAVGASLFVQGYAYRILTLAVSCLFMDGVLPGSRPAEMAIALSGGRPGFVAYRSPRLLMAAAGAWDGAEAEEVFRAIVDDAIENHLRALVERTASRYRIGRRLLWGNVAASAAVAFRTMEGLLEERVKPLGELFFSVVPGEMKGQGSFRTLEHAGRSVWYWERRNCCLHDRLPDRIRCRDCSSTAPDQRLATYRAALEEAATTGYRPET